GHLGGPRQREGHHIRGTRLYRTARSDCRARHRHIGEIMMHQIATLFVLGNIRPMPGTWGSLAALPIALVLLWIGGPWLFLIALALVIAVDFPAAKAEIAASGESDPQAVIIDEGEGQWVALLPVAFGAWMMNAAYTALWP